MHSTIKAELAESLWEFSTHNWLFLLYFFSFCDFSQTSDGIGSLKRSCRCDQSGSDRRPSSRCKPLTQLFFFFCGRFFWNLVFFSFGRATLTRAQSAFVRRSPGKDQAAVYKSAAHGAVSAKPRPRRPPSPLSPSRKKKKKK